MRKMPSRHLRSTSQRWGRCTARIGRVSRESRPGTLCLETLWRWQVRIKILNFVYTGCSILGGGMCATSHCVHHHIIAPVGLCTCFSLGLGADSAHRPFHVKMHNIKGRLAEQMHPHKHEYDPALRDHRAGLDQYIGWPVVLAGIGLSQICWHWHIVH